MQTTSAGEDIRKSCIKQVRLQSLLLFFGTRYSFWFEIFRRDLRDQYTSRVTVEELPANPGDQVYVQVWINPDYDRIRNIAQVNFYLYNATQNKNCGITIRYQNLNMSPPSTAEWIVERPEARVGLSPRLANFGTISFTQARYSAQWDGQQSLLQVSDDANHNAKLQMWNADDIFLALTDDVRSDGQITVHWRNPK